MIEVGDEIRLDGDPVTVTDLIEVEEPGEDGDSWELEEITDAQGAVRLIETDEAEITLYRPVETPPEPGAVDWEGEYSVSVKRRRDKSKQKLGYNEGEGKDGQSYMALGDNVWVMEDYVLRYGPDDHWVARSRTPARQLSPYTVDETDARQGVGAVGWLVVGLLLLWGIVDTFIFGAGFRWGWWIGGMLMMFVAGLSHMGRTTLVLGGSFGAWLLTAPFAPTLLKVVPGLMTLSAGQAQQIWALVMIVLFGLASVVTHRPFYMLGDGTALAGVTCVVVYTLILLGIACGDEDLGWMDGWLWYFRATPYRYIWLGAWAVWLVYYYFDYRNVPLTHRSFVALRDRVIRLLQRDKPLARAKTIGDCVDDLADAIHLSDDLRVRALSAYRALLNQVAGMLRGAAKDSVGHWLRRWDDQVRDDLALLAEELASMRPGGPGLRVSPVLRLATSDNPERDWWLGDED